MKMNSIGHVKKGNSDKVYIVSIIENKDGTFNVVGRYGRRNGDMKEDLKASNVTKWAAEAAADKLKRSKFNRSKDPFVDIDSPDYRHGLTRNDSWLKRWLEPETTGATKAAKAFKSDPATSDPDPIPPSATKATAPAKPAKTIDDEVVCVNNAGLEDQFDFGVEYIWVKGNLSDDFIVVLDKYNQKREVFSERFMTVKEATAKGLINEAVSV